ncbi:hypothetical protein [Pseudomonas aeruginosa]|uniref:hypothetical protein n=1 Tax=Pseudomonas aeruginosa TaxID=287 RepID=UPI0012985BF9|nr:hypothetical protein [Pseudomonas aeruginosa]
MECHLGLRAHKAWLHQRANPKTAGAIAKRLLLLADGLAEHPDRTEFMLCAQKFSELVEHRNGLMHGRPGTDSSDQKAKLFRNGEAWTAQKIQDIANEFSECSIQLNKHLHGFLKAVR